MFVALLKRFAPFVITFALGLFIASFFVSIAMPQFSFRRYRAMRQCQEMQRLRMENERLSQQLQDQQMKTKIIVLDAPAAAPRLNDVDFDKLVPSPPVAIKKIK